MTERKWHDTQDIVPCAEAGATRQDLYEIKIGNALETQAYYCPGNQRWYSINATGTDITTVVTHWRPLADKELQAEEG